jgi:hypothetical protein
LENLLRNPTKEEWGTLSRFDYAVSREDFVNRLDKVFDPVGGLRPFLRLDGTKVEIYAALGCEGQPIAVVRFKQTPGAAPSLPPLFGRATSSAALPHLATGLPLTGLRVAIDPADIGGAWATMEDRSVEFRGFGRINEGDLNLVVGTILRDELVRDGASVFLVRQRAEPVLALSQMEGEQAAEAMLRARPSLLPGMFRNPEGSQVLNSPRQLRAAADVLLTKTAEARARAAYVRRSFHPDITIVLQFDATPESTKGLLTRINRNIFFLDGTYLPGELSDPSQRLRLLTKLLENVTPTETAVAESISKCFWAATGFPPVLYGNSANTRLVLQNNPYVVSRNLELNRDHDGPVVVTEPYFMNQPETLARLLAGDYPGERPIAGKLRASIFREYAGCVTAGIIAAYHPTAGQVRDGAPNPNEGGD